MISNKSVLLQGILTKEFGATVANSSTAKDAYREPIKNSVRQKGARLEKLEKKLYEIVRYDYLCIRAYLWMCVYM